MANFTDYDFFGILYLINKASYYFRGKTRLQKMIMLAKEEEKYPFSFEFVRYHYGPFSFDLQNIVSDLVRFGFIEEQNYMTAIGPESQYRLTKNGYAFLEYLNSKIEQKEKNKLDELWKRYKFLDTRALIARAKEVFGW